MTEFDDQKSPLPEPESNPLGKVLALIADVMGTTVSSELMIQAGAVSETKADIEEPAENYLIPEKQSGAANRGENTSYAPSTAGAKDSSRIAAEPMLFADDSRSSGRAVHKPHHRIRAYRRASRKRPARRLEGQGTLFELDGASQSAA